MPDAEGRSETPMSPGVILDLRQIANSLTEEGNDTDHDARRVGERCRSCRCAGASQQGGKTGRRTQKCGACSCRLRKSDGQIDG